MKKIKGWAVLNDYGFITKPYDHIMPIFRRKREAKICNNNELKGCGIVVKVLVSPFKSERNK